MSVCEVQFGSLLSLLTILLTYLFARMTRSQGHSHMEANFLENFSAKAF